MGELQVLLKSAREAMFSGVLFPVTVAVLLGCLFTETAIAQTVAADKLDRLTTASTDRKTFLSPFRVGNDREYVEFSGHINKGVLVYDDGVQTLDYWFVDNANSPTRARLKTYIALGDQTATGTTLEGQWNPYSTAIVDQTNRGHFNGRRALLRIAEIWFGDDANTDMYGRLSAGHGSMASDGTTEVDLSGTGVVGYSGIGDLAGGQYFRTSGTNTLSSTFVYDGFRNLDGLGRRLRVRYDSPSFAGFTLSTSFGSRVVPIVIGKPGWDGALRYDYDNGQTRFAAALAYSEIGDGAQIFSGSATIRLPSYVNFTLAAANRRSLGKNRQYVYGKIGYIAHLIEAGTTAFSVDGYFGRNFNTRGSRSTSYGFQVVQNLDYWRTEVYLGVRRYEFSEVLASYQDTLGFLAGVRIKF